MKVGINGEPCFFPLQARFSQILVQPVCNASVLGPK